MTRYQWMMSRAAARAWRPPRERRSRKPFAGACANCGYDPIGYRKTCPACLAPRGRVEEPAP